MLAMLLLLFLPLLSAAPLDSTGGLMRTNIEKHNHGEAAPLDTTGGLMRTNIEKHNHGDMEYMERLRQMFKSIDANGDGIMEANEFVEFSRENNIHIKETEAEKVLTLTNGTVGFTEDEFVEVLKFCPSTITTDLIYFLMPAASSGGAQRLSRGEAGCFCNGYLDENGEGECNAEWPIDSNKFWCYIKEGSCSDSLEHGGNFWSYEACEAPTFDQFILATPGIAGMDQFAIEGLASHNSRRSVPLELDFALCEDAQAYANLLAANDAGMVHDENRQGQGENLAWAGPITWTDGRVESQNPDAEKAVKMWYDEKFTGEQCMGHYTQVVWKASKKFCMAKAEAKSKAVYTVARYYPSGNFVFNGQKQEAYDANVEEGFVFPPGC